MLIPTPPPPPPQLTPTTAQPYIDFEVNPGVHVTLMCRWAVHIPHSAEVLGSALHSKHLGDDT